MWRRAPWRNQSAVNISRRQGNSTIKLPFNWKILQHVRLVLTPTLLSRWLQHKRLEWEEVACFSWAWCYIFLSVLSCPVFLCFLCESESWSSVIFSQHRSCSEEQLPFVRPIKENWTVSVFVAQEHEVPCSQSCLQNSDLLGWNRVSRLIRSSGTVPDGVSFHVLQRWVFLGLLTPSHCAAVAFTNAERPYRVIRCWF